MSMNALIPIFLGFVVVFSLLLWVFISRSTSPQIVIQQTVPGPTYVKGPKPLDPVQGTSTVPNTLAWSITSPKAKRPVRSFQKVLPIQVTSSTTTIDLDSTVFIQLDPTVAQEYPLYTVLVVPSNCPPNVKVFQDRNACNYSLTNPLTCGIMPDISYNNELRADMSSINLTGPQQISFALQNRAAHTIYYVINASQNIQFEIPAGKTAVFFSQSNFWNTLLQRQSNPTQSLSPPATLVWKGALIPDRFGAQPEGPANSASQALQTAAAEVEAVQAARQGQQGGATSA